jgi:transaldolase
MNAYLAGLEDRLAEGGSVDGIASVASFFVSRIDTKIDGWLEEVIRKEDERAPAARALLGRLAVDNARLAYQAFKAVFSGERFTELQAQGARLQRPLWASTSTKNPAYPDVLYVETLIGPDTVNTVPPKTLAAFKDHGAAAMTLEDDLDAARANFDQFAALGLDFEQATDELEAEGVDAFAKAYTELLSTVEKRRSSRL